MVEGGARDTVLVPLTGERLERPLDVVVLKWE